MLYFHIFMMISGFILFLTGENLPYHLNIVGIGLALVGFVQILIELYKIEKAEKEAEVIKLQSLNKNNTDSIMCSLLFENEGYTPTLKEFSLLTLETDTNIVDVYCNKPYVIETIKYSEKPVRVYYYKNYVIDAEVIHNESITTI